MTHMWRILVSLVMVGIAFTNGTAAAVPYTLLPGTTFQEGCFGPCLCPISLSEEVTGTFILAPDTSDPLFTSYRLTEIAWTVFGFNGEAVHKITGEGTYKLGGEFGLMHQLTLDLLIDGAGPEHLDSGLIPGGSGFPGISIAVDRGTPCFDIMMKIEAAAQDADFPVALLESPADRQKISGIATIHGWAVDKKGITKVELFIDGQFVGNIPYGGTRADVGNAYPGFPNAGDSGFGMAWNYSLLNSGDHAIKVRVHNQDGLAKDLDALVTVVTFHGEFVEKMIPTERWLRKNAVTVDGITQNYDIKIEWSEETQRFEITDVIKK